MSEPNSRPRLLIVEPDDAVRRVLGRALKDRFEVAPVGKGALARLAEERFDVMLLDLGLKEADELLVMARASRLPVVGMNSSGDAVREAEAMALGAVICVTKPFSVSAINAALAQAVG